jgi:hypothetical protein
MQQNAEVAKILQEKYQQNVRAQFRQVFLAGADDNLLKLLDDVLGK